MKYKTLICYFIMFSSILILFLQSCSTTYDDMLQDYNNNFEKVIPEASLPNVNNEGFDQAAIIPSLSYTANFGDIFEINATEGGVSYKWQMFIKAYDENDWIPVDLGKTDVTQKRISIVITDLLFEAGIAYVVKVTVVNKAGTTLTDTADFAITKKLEKIK